MFPSRFQFERTRDIRFAAYRAARLSLRARVLDVGAGEGLVAEEMALRTGRTVCALDLEGQGSVRPGVSWVKGDAHALPFADGSLDAAAFHFVLLWLHDPVSALREARRVLRPDGVVLILSEPDLRRRQDDPETGLGSRLARVVARSGGHPGAGAEVGSWLAAAGFRPRLQESGAEWVSLQDPREIRWEIAFLLRMGALSEEGATALEARESAASARRVLLPLTYGVASKE